MKKATNSKGPFEHDKPLEELSEQVSQLDNNMKTLFEDHANYKTQIDNLSIGLTNCSRTIDSINSQFLSSKINGHGPFGGISTNDNRIEALARDSVANNRKIETFRKEIESSSIKIESLSHAQDLSINRIETIETGLNKSTLAFERFAKQSLITSKSTESDIASIKARLEVLEKENRSRDDRLQVLEKENAELSSTTESLNNNCTANFLQIEHLESKIQEIQRRSLEQVTPKIQRVAELENALEEIRRDLEILQSRFHEGSKTVEDSIIQKFNDSQNQSLKALEDTIEKRNKIVDAHLESLKEEFSEKGLKLKLLEDNRTTLNEKIENSDLEIEKARTKLVALEAGIVEIKDKIESLQSAITSTITGFQESIGDSNRKIQFLENDFARASETTSNRITAIETQIASKAASKQSTLSVIARDLDDMWQLEEIEVEEL